MPIDLVLVRHGQSEGNVAIHMSKRGDFSAFTEEFMCRHSSVWRLTNRGIEQAQITGAWLQKNMNVDFDRYYTSDYLRAKETAALLGLPNAKWYTDFMLRERDQGESGDLTPADRLEKFKKKIESQEVQPFYRRPSNGESMADTCMRIDSTIQTLHRECANKRVIIVSHGEVMWSFRVLLERMSQEQWLGFQNSNDPCDRINNGQVLHYTRCNPETKEIGPYLSWMRSICPSKQEWSRPDWVQITHDTFTDQDLLLDIQKYPRICNLEY